jgi:hypothetical protein
LAHTAHLLLTAFAIGSEALVDQSSTRKAPSAPSADALELSIEQPIFLVDKLSQTILVLLTVVLNLVACGLPMSGSAWLEPVVQPINLLCLIGRDIVQM